MESLGIFIIISICINCVKLKSKLYVCRNLMVDIYVCMY